jgi:DNA-directed RNA polymerase subunit K/omega
MATIEPDDVDTINPEEVEVDIDEDGDMEEFDSGDEIEEDDNEEDGDLEPPQEEDDDDIEDDEPDNEKANEAGAIVPDDLEEGVVEPIEEEDLLGDHNKKITHHDEILLLHPESKFHNYDEIASASIVTRNENNIIVDALHTTIPMMTKYEKTKVIGQRTKQLDVGSQPFIRVDRPTLDNSIIAEQELREKKLPFIIQRPLPNGGFEYWHVKDLEVF